jgi:L-ascorbate metabolism protein UlaG (beta-lactamase superfamily)
LLEISYFGHSFFQLKFGDKKVLIDPFIKCNRKDEAFKRLQDCKIAEKDLENISLILLSHEHFDHFDKELVKRLAEKNNACVVGHESVLQQIGLQKRLTHSIATGEKVSLRGVNVKAVTAHHPQAFYPLGFVIEGDGKTVYHAGDTDLIDEFNEIKTNVALLPIGGTYTMDVVDAVRATKSMKPDYVIPMHYNTFNVIQADPNEFKQKIEKSILKTKPVILKPGENFKLD